MRKTFLQVAALLLLSSSLWASKTTLSGTITDAQGNGVYGTLVMSLPVPAQDITTNAAVSNMPVFFSLVNGSISGGPQLYDVANLQPQNLYYIARAYDSSGNLIFAGNYSVTGGTFNLGAATPTSITTSNISYLNPASQNGANVFSGVNSFTNSNTFSGAVNFTGSVSFSSVGFNGAITSTTFTLTNPGIFTNTQMNEYDQSLINGCSSSTEYNTVQTGNFSTDAIAGCAAMPSGATVHQANGIAGYANNSVATAQSGGAVGGYFQGRVLVSGPGGGNGNGTWGLNSIVVDTVGTTSTQMISQEADFNAFGTPVRAWGLLVSGASTGTLPASFSNSSGITVRAPGFGVCSDACASTKQWPSGLYVEDGAANTAGVIIGTTSSANSTSNLGLQLNTRDSGGTLRPVTVGAQPIGGSSSALTISAPVQKLNVRDQGQCTMSTGACSAQTLNNTYSSAPTCFATWTGTGTLAGAIKIASTTTTVTPSSSTGTDTAQVNWFCIGT